MAGLSPEQPTAEALAAAERLGVPILEPSWDALDFLLVLLEWLPQSAGAPRAPDVRRERCALLGDGFALRLAPNPFYYNL